MVKKREYENRCREQRGSKANETEKEAERSRREEGKGQDRKEKDARQGRQLLEKGSSDVTL